MTEPTNIQFSGREDRSEVESGLTFAPKFDDDGLITAVAQDADSGEVLMVAYMNEDSLRETIRLGEAVYWSRSRQQIWHKGGTSGHVQVIENILTDCDQDALVLKVRQKGPGCCHNGYRSCFYRKIEGEELTTIGEPVFDPKEVYGK
jgi:phosphoribosyl-AMP cyclohydrolase